MKCFRHPESDAVGTCKHCFKGTCSACAEDAGIGIVCSPQCEEEVRAVKFLVNKNKQAYPLVAKAHGRNAILLTLFGLAFIAFSFIARGDSFCFRSFSCSERLWPSVHRSAC